MKVLCSLLLAGLSLVACATRTPPSSVAPAPAARTDGALVLDGMPELDPRVRERLRPYMEARSASLAGWLPESAGVLISTRFGRTNQLHTVAFAEAARRQITFFDEPVAEAAVSPDPAINGLIFAKDSGGDEYFQLYFMRLDTLAIRPLTSNKARNERPLLAAKGGRYAYSSSVRNGQDIDVWIGDLTSDAPARLATEKPGSWYALDFSHDGKYLLLQNYVSIVNSTLYLLELESLTLEPLLPKQKTPSANPQARFSFDDKGVYYLSDEGDDIIMLNYLERASGLSTVITPHRSWDVTEFALSAQDQEIAFIDNLGGSNRVSVANRGAVGVPLDKPFSEIALQGGLIGQLEFNPAGTDLGFVLSGPQIPGDVLSMNVASKQMTRWTRNETGGLNAEEFVVPTLETAGSFDTQVLGLPRQIPALYYRPQRDTPAPVVIMLHGGPEAQAQPGFDPFIQFLVRELKFAVITPNVRGSSGFGREYLGLDDGVKRMDSVRDVKAWLDWIPGRPELDSKKVVVYGGSYGGFLVLAALANFSDQLAGGVDIVGISNLVSFLENTNPYRRDQRREEYGDERIPEIRKALEEVSPLNNVAGIRKPLLVIQGANDPRVPRSESEQIVKAVREQGQKVWYMLATNEGHGFRKKENLDAMRVAVVMWLERLLIPLGPVAP